MSKWNFWPHILIHQCKFHSIFVHRQYSFVYFLQLFKRDDSKYEINSEFMVERDSDGAPAKLTSTNTMYNHQQHVFCLNESDQNEYLSEHIEIEDYHDEQYEEEDDENDSSMVAVMTAAERSDANRSQTSANTANTESHQQTVNLKPETSSLYHSHDPDERFLLSCLPIFQRLSNKKNALARLKIQQLLFDIEFSDDNS